MMHQKGLNSSRVQIRCKASRPSKGVLVRATSSQAPPSYRPAATELELLQQLSTCVPDRVDSDRAKSSAATVSFGLLRRLATGEAVLGVKPLQNAIAAARNYSPDPDRTVEKAMANVGAMLAEMVEGKISTDLDPRLAHDKSKLVLKAKSLRNLYQELRVPYNRLLFRVPATFAGIQAAKELEDAGIATHVHMVFSLAQAAAAGQAGASLVTANVGRVRDWYTKHPGYIRDPQGPRQDVGGLSGVDPGVSLVKQIYNYLKVHHPKTQIMATSIRNREDALALAGVDFLLLPPKVMSELERNATLAGYNDSLHPGAGGETGGEEEGDEGVTPQLTVEAAKQAPPPKVGPFTSEKDFEEAIGLAGRELLAENLRGALQDVDALASLHKSNIGVSTL